MYQKPKGLAMNGENFEKIYTIENTVVIRLPLAWCLEKKRGKN
jgi:hypothetical protein